MASPRCLHAIETGAFALPAGARMVLLEPAPDAPLDALDGVVLTIQHSFKPSYDTFAAAGHAVMELVQDAVDFAHVTMPRSRELARGLIAQANDLAQGGVVLVDGAKTDGIDSVLKLVKSRVGVHGQIAKAHGKLFWFAASDAFEDWRLPDPAPVADGWTTQPGVFSADGPDAGSEALVATWPKIKGHVADLGGGWGYLTRHLLDMPGVSHVDLVEADKRALQCAARNLSDPRAALHWADATRWGKAGVYDWVVMNPPFHTSRTPDASIGHAFIRSAARLLKPKGQLVMVANRHLPYETVLAASFGLVQELGGDSRFKVLQADHPKPPQRTVRTRRR